MRTLRTVLLTALLGALSACAPREVLLPWLGMEPPRLQDFPADFQPPRSHSTGQPMPGFGGGGGGLQRTPVIFVHGNTVSARFWLPAREHFLKAGYTPDELWALGYGWDNVRYFDSHDLSVPSLDRIVEAVTTYLERRSGRAVPQVDIVAHSLGVTLVRQWMLQTNQHHRVRRFVGVAGANAGVWTASMDSRGQNRVVSLELAPDSPWLAQLNRAGGVIGGVEALMLYDGGGWADVLFPKPLQHSPALPGARNLAFNVEQGSHYDHLELPRSAATSAAILDFLRDGPAADPRRLPPRLRREGNQLLAEPATARLHCREDARYPSRADPGQTTLTLTPGVIHTCFAHDAASSQSSPMQRHTADDGLRTPGARLAARPAGGVHAYAQHVTLEAVSGDAPAFIVYTLNGGTPTSGSPRYLEPIFIPGPVTLQARAVMPDGRLGEVLRLEVQISLEREEAERGLRRQFEPDAPVEDRQRRIRGR
jgi:predicted alpha/beta hydrolase family esterase